MLKPLADAGDAKAMQHLAALLAEQGRAEELRSRVEAGDWNAAQRLAELLAEQS